MNKYWGPNPDVLAYVESLIQPGQRVLEIGPGHVPFSKATHFVNRVGEPIKGETALVDVNSDKLPFTSKSFAFVYCRHVLEDLAYPDLLLEEMERVGEAGYIETPSPMVELSRGVDGGSDPPYRGYIHHRWVVWEKDGELFLIEKGNAIEHLALPQVHETIPIPLFWNTYFFWKEDLLWTRLRHDREFDLHRNYKEMLDAACESAIESTMKVRTRLQLAR